MLKNVFWAIMNGGVSAFFSFFAVVYVSRNIEPERFLQLSLVISLLAIGNVLIDLGYSQKLLLKRQVSTKLLYVIECGINQRIMMVVFGVLAFMWSQGYIGTFSIEVVILLLTTAFVYGYNFSSNLTFNRQRLFKEKTILSGASAFISSVISIVLTFLGNPDLAFVSLQVLTPILLGILMRRRLGVPLRPNSNVSFKFSFKRLFSKQFLFQLTERVDEFARRFILSAVPASFGAALYLRNETILYSPLKLLNKALERVALSTWGPEALSSNTLRSTFNYMFVCTAASILIFGAVSFFGSYITEILLGDKWKIDGSLYYIIGVLLGLRFLVTQALNFTKIRTKQFHIAFWSSFIGLIALGGLILLIGASTLQHLLTAFILSQVVKLLAILIWGSRVERLKV